ncbi:hypothetical protein OS121_03875 [Mycolicibacterium mucogenicum]|uniref:hypothetical protein n=1 Tax=Mycolicibacterium mucogenicum TaxID=56689 RepID=UPI00226A15A0|nr:hypothetical protein [Mycolicibacterium mucogenicum]MCX8554241.1 hypothetical protein [Mycolicibacterium mucogenicum]
MGRKTSGAGQEGRKARKTHTPKPLYREANTLARGFHHPAGGDFRDTRNTKAEIANDRTRGSMRPVVRGHRVGRDYTPLFKFLLAAVGRHWRDVHSEATARLDTDEPLYWMVAVNEADRVEVVRLGDCSFYSGLFVDDEGLLRVTNPDLTAAEMTPTCSCCTHTFNGVPFGTSTMAP